MNSFSYLFLAALIGNVLVQRLLARRHIRHIQAHRDTVPADFRDRVTPEEHRKAADYSIAKVRLGNIELMLGSTVLLIWTLGGVLQWLDGLWRGVEWPMLWTGTGFILSVTIISSLIDLPLSAYRTFVIEEQFGFNKTTAGTFFADLGKGLLLSLLIGLPIIALVLWLMQNTGDLWWLYVWATWLGFSLFMLWFYPAFIAPLFNRFRPLEDDSLRERIETLLDRNGFTSQGIFVMDGSARSTHGNAYFTGLGGNKRIVFFDTLIDKLSPAEIEAVLAHELGHFKRHHIKKRIATMAILFLGGFALLGWLIDKPWFYNGLGVEMMSIYMALTLFFMVVPVFTFYLQPLSAWLSRRHEFEADDFAAEQAHSQNLIQALVKLYKENASTLTPDPLYSAFHDSHPPAPIRIAHLSESQ